MDEATLTSLKAALAANPENRELALVVARALLERSDALAARAALQHCDPAALERAQDRWLVARVLLAAGEASAALPYASGKDAEARLLRARVLLALERNSEALVEYRAAVEQNPTLEDLELAAQLRAEVRKSAAGGPKLRVIANYDTRELETARLF